MPVSTEDEKWLDEVLSKEDPVKTTAPNAKPSNKVNPENDEAWLDEVLKTPDKKSPSKARGNEDEAWLDAVLSGKPQEAQVPSFSSKKQKKKINYDKAAKDFDIDPLEMVKENPALLNEATEIAYRRQGLKNDKPTDYNKIFESGLQAGGLTLRGMFGAPIKAAGNLIQNVAYSPITQGKWASDLDAATHGLDVAQSPIKRGIRNLADYIDPIHGLAKIYEKTPESWKRNAEAETNLNAIESAGAIETGVMGSADFGVKIGRALFADPLRKTINTITGEGHKLTKEQLRDRLAADAAWEKTIEESGQGDTSLLGGGSYAGVALPKVDLEKTKKDTGASQESIAAGISDLSFYADPIDLGSAGAGAAAGKAFSILGKGVKATKTGGKILEAAGKATGKVSDIVGRARNVAKGQVMEKLGHTGVGLKKALISPYGQLALPVTGAAIGYMSGGEDSNNVLNALIGAATGSTPGKLGRLAVGLKKTQIFERMADKGSKLLGKFPKYGVFLDPATNGPGLLTKAGRFIKPELVAAGGGLAFAAPLLLTAENEEDIGNILGGAVAAGAAGNIRNRTTQAFDAYFQVKNNPKLRNELNAETRTYDTEPSLDVLHEEAISNLPKEEVENINRFRDLTQGQVEIYVLPGDKFDEVIGNKGERKGTAAAAYSVAEDDGGKRIFLKDTSARMGHEVGHFLMSELPEKEFKGLVKTMNRYHKDDVARFREKNEALINRKLWEEIVPEVDRLNAGTASIEDINKIKAQRDKMFKFKDDNEVISEFLAEQYHLTTQGQPVENFLHRQGIARKIFQNVASYAERLSKLISTDKAKLELMSNEAKKGFTARDLGLVPSFILNPEIEKTIRNFALKNKKEKVSLPARNEAIVNIMDQVDSGRDKRRAVLEGKIKPGEEGLKNLSPEPVSEFAARPDGLRNLNMPENLQRAQKQGIQLSHQPENVAQVSEVGQRFPDTEPAPPAKEFGEESVSPDPDPPLEGNPIVSTDIDPTAPILQPRFKKWTYQTPEELARENFNLARSKNDREEQFNSDSRLIQKRKSGLTQRNSYSGTLLNTDDPVQRKIADRMNPITQEVYLDMSRAIAQGKATTMLYNSAKYGEITKEGREKSYKDPRYSVANRIDGMRLRKPIGDVASKSIMPTGYSFSEPKVSKKELNQLTGKQVELLREGYTLNVHGFSPPRAAANTDHIFGFSNAVKTATENGIIDLHDFEKLYKLIPYKDVFDPNLARDIQAGFTNHANGFSMNGTPLRQVEGVNLTIKKRADFNPTKVPDEGVGFITAILGVDFQAFKENSKKRAALIEFEEKQINPRQQVDGGYNPLLIEMRRLREKYRDKLSSTPDGKKLLRAMEFEKKIESTYETLKLDLMLPDPERGLGFRESGLAKVIGEAGAVPNLDLAALNYSAPTIQETNLQPMAALGKLVGSDKTKSKAGIEKVDPRVEDIVKKNTEKSPEIPKSDATFESLTEGQKVDPYKLKAWKQNFKAIQNGELQKISDSAFAEVSKILSKPTHKIDFSDLRSEPGVRKDKDIGGYIRRKMQDYGSFEIDSVEAARDLLGDADTKIRKLSDFGNNRHPDAEPLLDKIYSMRRELLDLMPDEDDD